MEEFLESHCLLITTKKRATSHSTVWTLSPMKKKSIKFKYFFINNSYTKMTIKMIFFIKKNNKQYLFIVNFESII